MFFSFISYNLNGQDVHNPREVERFFKELKRKLPRCVNLTALDLAGNHLFDHFPHSESYHERNYVDSLTAILPKTTISHLDLSENNITGTNNCLQTLSMIYSLCMYYVLSIIGNTGREYKGLSTLMTTYMIKQKAFKCCFNKINSLGFKTICQGEIHFYKFNATNRSKLTCRIYMQFKVLVYIPH